VLTVIMKVKESDNLEKVIEALKENAKNARQEKGCIRFEISQDQKDTTRLILHEAYRSADAVKQHSEAPYVQACLGVVRQFADVSEFIHSSPVDLGNIASL